MTMTSEERMCRMCRKLMDRHGLTDWQFELMDAPWISGKQVAGQCDHAAKIIRLNRELVSSPRLARQTMLHEIAHALLPKSARHGWEFCRLARKLGCYDGLWRYEMQNELGLLPEYS